MTAILAKMRRNAISAGLNGQFCGGNRIRMCPAPCIAQSCNMINIHAKA
jgi:hypothetical protein